MGWIVVEQGLDVCQTLAKSKHLSTACIIACCQGHTLLRVCCAAGYAGMTNTPKWVIEATMQSFSELPARLAQFDDPVVLVASSGQESLPPVSR